jgi:hypothetical protein
MLRKRSSKCEWETPMQSARCGRLYPAKQGRQLHGSFSTTQNILTLPLRYNQTTEIPEIASFLHLHLAAALALIAVPMSPKSRPPPGSNHEAQSSQLPTIGPDDPFVRVVKALSVYANPSHLVYAFLIEIQLFSRRNNSSFDLRTIANNVCGK